MFDENSGLVKTWVRLIRKDINNKPKVPNLSNLREVIYGIINAK